MSRDAEARSALLDCSLITLTRLQRQPRIPQPSVLQWVRCGGEHEVKGSGPQPTSGSEDTASPGLKEEEARFQEQAASFEQDPPECDGE